MATSQEYDEFTDQLAEGVTTTGSRGLSNTTQETHKQEHYYWVLP